MKHRITKKDGDRGRPIFVFENKWYCISKIPLNWKIDIKKSLTMKNHQQQLERDYYVRLTNTLEQVKKEAENLIEQYWRPVTAQERAKHVASGLRLLRGRSQL